MKDPISLKILETGLAILLWGSIAIAIGGSFFYLTALIIHKWGLIL